MTTALENPAFEKEFQKLLAAIRSNEFMTNADKQERVLELEDIKRELKHFFELGVLSVTGTEAAQ